MRQTDESAADEAATVEARDRLDCAAELSASMQAQIEAVQEEVVAMAADEAERTDLPAQFATDQRQLRQRLVAAREHQTNKMQDRITRKVAMKQAKLDRETVTNGVVTEAAAEETVEAIVAKVTELERSQMEAEVAEEEARLLTESLKNAKAQSLAKQAAATSSADLAQQAQSDSIQVQQDIARKRATRQRALEDKLARKRAELDKSFENSTQLLQHEYLQKSIKMKEQAQADDEAMSTNAAALIDQVEAEQESFAHLLPEDADEPRQAIVNQAELAAIDREAELEAELLQVLVL